MNSFSNLFVVQSGQTLQKKPEVSQSRPPSDIFSDKSAEMIDNSIIELKGLLTDICQEGNEILKKFQSQIQGTNLKKLESMLPKLNEASNKLKTNLTSLQGKIEPLNGKRNFQEIEDDDADDIMEVIPAANGFKKVKLNPPNGFSQEAGLAFRIKFLCNKEIQGFLPNDKVCREAQWFRNGTKSIMTLKREDFLFFNPAITLRLSKEHATITATKIGNQITYEITDNSVNGIYFLGNKAEGRIKSVPARLQKGIPLQLKNGDIICLLLNKSLKTPEVVLGFEFEVPEDLDD